MRRVLAASNDRSISGVAIRKDTTLTKKVALVTAAGSGMGAAIARKLADLNYNVAILSSSGRGEAPAAVERFKKALAVLPDDPIGKSGLVFGEYLVAQAQGGSQTG